MQNQQSCDKIGTNPRWLICPVCKRGKVLKLLPGTQVRNLPVFCRQCRRESIVNIPQSLSP